MMIISVVGSGGKTGHIRELARQYRNEGRKVFVTTTTHMYLEQDTVLYPANGDENECRAAKESMKKRLSEGYCMAGAEAERKKTDDGLKITALPDRIFRELSEAADITLVEADGARHMLLKYPGINEPVIPEGTDEVHIITNLSAIGMRCCDCTHRAELAAECLGISADQIIKAEHIQKLIREGYLKKFENRSFRVKILPMAADTPYKERIAAFLEKNITIDESGGIHS